MAGQIDKDGLGEDLDVMTESQLRQECRELRRKLHKYLIAQLKAPRSWLADAYMVNNAWKRAVGELDMHTAAKVVDRVGEILGVP